MNNRGDDARVACPLFQAGNGGSTPTSPLQFTFSTINRETMEKLNRQWHSRLPVFHADTCVVCYGAEFEGVWYAVAAWSHPIARMLPSHWLELRRLAISDDAPRNTATRMIGWMAKDIRKRIPKVTRLISYQDTDVHAGTIYKAAGWTATNLSQRVNPNGKGGHWACRSGCIDQSLAPKQRWEKVLKEETEIVRVKPTVEKDLFNQNAGDVE